jgi:hypothetical protein
VSKKVITTAHVEDGRLMVHNRGRFLDACLDFKGRFIIVAEKDTRSRSQNALLWLYNDIVANELGWTKEQVHEFTKSKIHLTHVSRIDKRTGEIIDESFPGSTHDLAKDDMALYIERYQRYWAEEGIVLPDPETHPVIETK